MSKIGVFGAGWVGVVTAACFAELGHDVVVRDVSTERIDALREGGLPFHEPGLVELIERNAERMTFTLDADEAASDADFLYVCVGTPSTYSGDADLSYVWSVLDDLPELSGNPVLVMKSTVPVGTGEKVRAALDARGLEDVGYVSNPEFLAEANGRAATSCRPTASSSAHSIRPTATGSRNCTRSLDAHVVRSDVASAEMIKLAANAFLMTRISFINEIANVCELVGADVEEVARGIGLDHRLGPHFLRAGIGYGGILLPEGRVRAQAARVELRLPLPAALGGDRGERAPEAARRRQAPEASREAARQASGAPRAGLQAEHGRHARGAEHRARLPPARRGRGGARLGSRRPARPADERASRSATRSRRP